jgi:formylmethanofuran dehydrogenase subunit D
MGNAADQPLNVNCPFNLNTVVCFAEKVGVTTSDGEILIRVGCTDDCPEGDGWIFIDHKYEKET